MKLDYSNLPVLLGLILVIPVLLEKQPFLHIFMGVGLTPFILVPKVLEQVLLPSLGFLPTPQPCPWAGAGGQGRGSSLGPWATSRLSRGCASNEGQLSLWEAAMGCVLMAVTITDFLGRGEKGGHL